MKRVLVTGATGFLGRHALAPLARRGDEVHVISRQTAPAASPAAGWHTADLLDAAAVGRVVESVGATALLHMGWDVRQGRYWTSDEQVAWVGASLHLFQSFIRHGGRRLVAVGTCAEYDWRYGWCAEDVTPIAPVTLYGTCKNACHVVLSELARQKDVSAAWGRLFFLFGPFEHPQRLVPLLVNALLGNEPGPPIDRTQLRDFLHVADAAEALVALLNSEVTGPVNVASGEAISPGRLLELLTHEGGFGTPAGFADCPVHGAPRVLLAGVERLRREVGWRPAVRLEDRLRETLGWWREKQSEE